MTPRLIWRSRLGVAVSTKPGDFVNLITSTRGYVGGYRLKPRSSPSHRLVLAIGADESSPIGTQSGADAGLSHRWIRLSDSGVESVELRTPQHFS